MLTTAISVDLVIACDRSKPRDERLMAWQRYELDCWVKARKERGLSIRNMDSDCTGIDGESIQTLVCRKLGLPK